MSYATATTVLLGPTMALIVDWAVILTLFGTCVAYVNIIGALLPPVFALAASSSDSILCGESGIILWQILVSFLLFLPLSLIRNLDSLSSTSLAALVIMGAFVVVEIVIGIEAASNRQHIYDTLYADSGGSVCEQGGSSGGGTTSPDLTVRLFPQSAAFLGAIPLMCFMFNW